MKTASALAILALVASAPAMAQKAAKPTVLDQAKAYTDEKVAAEAAARAAADAAEQSARTAEDTSLQAQVTELKAKVDRVQRFSVGHGAFRSRGSAADFVDDEFCAWPATFRPLYLDVPVPAGSTIKNVTAQVRDTLADAFGYMTVRFQNANGYFQDEVQSSGVGIQDVTWMGDFVVPAGRWVSVNFGSSRPGDGGIAICGVTVTYTEPQ